MISSTSKTPRPVVVKGKAYSSLNEAARALKCSRTKVYRMLGEGWRFRGEKPLVVSAVSPDWPFPVAVV